MTFSIVARDPATGDVGVAVQSHWFAVGRETAHVRPGVGAVATQAVADRRFGHEGLDLLEDGVAPGEALDRMLASDTQPAHRQLAAVDRHGAVAARSGSGCIPVSEHRCGDGWSAQGNLLTAEGVPAAMGLAYVESEGDLAGRMLAALRAGQAAGGDLRGQQSAVMLVATRERRRPTVDVRVDDHIEPLEELGRLLVLQRAFHRMGLADERLTLGDTDGAAAAFRDAARLSGVPEIRFWHGLLVAEHDRIDVAREIMADLLEGPTPWRELLRRLPSVGLADPQVSERLLDA